MDAYPKRIFEKILPGNDIPLNRIEKLKKFIKLWESRNYEFDKDKDCLEILEAIMYLNEIKLRDLQCCGNCIEYDEHFRICLLTKKPKDKLSHDACSKWRYDRLTQEDRIV